MSGMRQELRRLERELQYLRCENEILREAAAPLIHEAAAHERFAFIHARRDRFTAKMMCRILVTDGGNYRAWTRNQDKREVRAYDEQQLTALILEVPTARCG
jgi:hypothetical protein